MSYANKANPVALATTTQDDGLLDKIVARMESVVARAAPPVQPMELRDFGELERWAERASRSSMVPPSYKGKVDDIILAVQMGSELGFRPMQSLQNIAVINGKPSVFGDAMLALCMTHPLYRSVQESIEGEGDSRAALCVVNRQGDAPKIMRFSVADAKRAGLWDKAGPWKNYPDRMLQMRARGFALRDAFPDKLRGLISAEEAEDYSLAAAGISAAPPPPEPKVDKPALVARALIDRFGTVADAQEFYTMVDEPKVIEQIAWLHANRRELFDTVAAARKEAADRTDGTPVPVAAPPADGELPE
jgi:hypothetical protein